MLCCSASSAGLASSIATRLDAPRDSASRPSAPEPAKASSTLAPSTASKRWISMLKIAWRARSEVGRTSSPSGTISLVPLCEPASMRMAPRFERRFLPLRRTGRGRARAIGLRGCILDPQLAAHLVHRLLFAQLLAQHLGRHFLDVAGIELAAQLERSIGDADQAADRPAEMA